jgi:hypothetical protein
MCYQAGGAVFDDLDAGRPAATEGRRRFPLGPPAV